MSNSFWDPTDCSLPAYSVHQISQARILECVAISFSRESSQPWWLNRKNLPAQQETWVQSLVREGSICVYYIHYIFFFNFLDFILYCVIAVNIVIVSGEQRRNSAMHIHVSILPQTPLPTRLLHNIEQSSIFYTLGPCWLSILNIAVYTWPFQTP